MTHLIFDPSKFDLESVKRWAAEKCVDGSVEEPQNPDECYVVRRSAVPDGEETRQMVLEDGITAVIVRSDAADIPDGYVAVVNEAAYGNWGWGQLDFMAAMAGVEFNEAMRESISVLESILREIVIWSALPLDVRKELANRALAQFGEYVGTVMDSLPRQLLVSVVRSANPQQEKSMTQQASGAATPEAKPSETNPAVEAEKPVTRAEIADLIRTGVEAAMKSFAPAAPVAAPAAAPEVAPVARADTTTSISREDIKSIVAEVVKPLQERIEAVAGATVVRSQGESLPASKEDDSGKTKDVFRGAFPGLRPAKTA